MMSPEGDEQTRNDHLEWRDYIAITIALLETTLLPLVISIVVLILIVLVLRR